MEDQIQDGTLYRHYSLIKKWDKNEEVTTITQENWWKLIASIKKLGVVDALKVGFEDSVSYDGNHRRDAVAYIVETEGITVSENGKDIRWLPIQLKHIEKESDKWTLSIVSHSTYREWNSENLANYTPEFENDIDLSLINISFSPNLSFPDTIEEPEEAIDSAKPERVKKEITCPNCSHTFTQ